MRNEALAMSFYLESPCNLALINVVMTTISSGGLSINQPQISPYEELFCRYQTDTINGFGHHRGSKLNCQKTFTLAACLGLTQKVSKARSQTVSNNATLHRNYRKQARCHATCPAFYASIELIIIQYRLCHPLM